MHLAARNPPFLHSEHSGRRPLFAHLPPQFGAIGLRPSRKRREGVGFFNVFMIPSLHGKALSETQMENSSRKELVWGKRTRIPALEIRIDAIPDMYRGGWQTPIRDFLKQWVGAEVFSGQATFWQWGSMSANYIPNADWGWSEFIIQFGLPMRSLELLEEHLSGLFMGCVRISEEVEARRSMGWAPFCHVEQSRVWRPEDTYTWCHI